MKIYLFSAKGDELVAETFIIKEAEKILREYQQKGCAVITGDSVIIDKPEYPLPDEAWILWPMSGGEVKKTCKTIKI